MGRTAPTRRDTIKYGSVLAAGGLLAGCTNSNPDETPEDSSGDSPDTETPYSVMLEPAGEEIGRASCRERV